MERLTSCWLLQGLLRGAAAYHDVQSPVWRVLVGAQLERGGEGARAAARTDGHEVRS